MWWAMFKLITASIRMFISLLLLQLRENTEVSVSETPFVYRHQLLHSDGTHFILEIMRSHFHVQSNRWFIPNLDRFLYKSTLKRYQGKTLIDTDVWETPALSRDRYLDIHYPFACVATVHLNKYFGDNKGG